MTRRHMREYRFAPNKKILKKWMRLGGKRHLRRLERREAKRKVNE